MKKTRIKKLMYFGALVIIFFVSVIFMLTSNSSTKESEKLKIVTTIFPFEDFAKNIGGEKVDVDLLLPPGVEPHSFEPTIEDVRAISESDIFIFTGKTMEPWAEDMINDLDITNTIVIDASSVLEKDLNNTDQFDPHIWLDFDNDKKIIDLIENALSQKDNSNKNFYQDNAANYKSELTQLDDKYKSSLSKCKNREIIYGGHYAFGYLASRYALDYQAAQGFSPDSEPTAEDIAKLIEFVKKNNIKYIFYEELSSPQISETISEETQAQLLLLSAAHNITQEDYKKNTSFISVMESNLDNLIIGLECNNE